MGACTPRASGCAWPTPTRTWSSGSASSPRSYSALSQWESEDGYQEVTLQSVRLARWWQAAGFAKQLPGPDHVGKGWIPRIPSAILEADQPGREQRGSCAASSRQTEPSMRVYPAFPSPIESFAAEVRTLLLATGLATTTRRTVSGWGGPIYQVRLRNVDHALEFGERIGFISERRVSAAGVPGTRSVREEGLRVPASAGMDGAGFAGALGTQCGRAVSSQARRDSARAR